MKRACWLSAWIVIAVLAILLSTGSPVVAEVTPGDIAIVCPDATDFGISPGPMVRLKPGTQMLVTERRGSWVGAAVQVDGKRQLGWVHQSAVQRVAGDAASASAMATQLSQLMAKQVRVQLDGLGHLHLLDAAGSKITDDDLAICEKSNHLVAADLSDTAVGDAGVARLAKAATLERVYLQNTAVTGSCLENLAELQHIEVLVLGGSRIKGPDLAKLASAATIRTLNVAKCEVRDEDLRHLQPLVHIEVLVLADNGLKGNGLDQLRALRSLRVLNLSRTEITDPALVHLEGAPSLRMLYVRGTQITTEASDKLDRTLTSASIYR